MMSDTFVDEHGKAPPGASSSSSYDTATAAGAPAQRKAGSSSDGVPFLLRSGGSGGDGLRRCMGLIDFVLRVAAFGPTLAAAISIGTSDERLSVFTNFFQFRARFDDFPAFTFFMVANAIAAGYMVLSLPFSAASIMSSKAATGVKLLLLICDTIMAVLLTAAAAAATAMVYVAHEGNLRANWVPICLQFHGFCQRTSGAVIASFLAVLVLMILVVMAACSIPRRR
ncbi:hypothetical protein E2562_020757 [Oryza meyeriana var. granulata]|uniref:CASP-like protein n=1 Tax=Oryza meyeriana var. granulata TaxID=110450 RepID=A0A6G1CHL8_9ORYZ|nr:hypothetical protein E2562_020757 [Oryza meyeriana var. granulata]